MDPAFRDTKFEPIKGFRKVLSLEGSYSPVFLIYRRSIAQALKPFRNMRKQIFTTYHISILITSANSSQSFKKYSSGKTFCVNSPWIKNIEKIYSSYVRRAKLYYLQDRTVKGARLTPH